MSDPDEFPTMAGATEVAMAVQLAALRLLEAEVVALARILPGAGPGGHPVPTSDGVIEEDFDNMPV